ncbi:hypothetical protein C7437_101517 [Psychrobacillus insolitus]|uniref:Uncharacterized protein n=1 Tax=Psychrobacillus insolitus TaxID=1461 RepID=A0A2W7MQF6_9BACI|nr:hypothetical protein [Psychrobacillus insolitus]PZX07404.1 hypothetical protein C7437_101517 [Psychrobacillus insolitus]
MNNLETVGWAGIISILLIIFSFYFTLTFFENLHKGNERITKQSKLTAIVCLGLALLIPVLYSFIFHL